eukprot:764362-Hanusia_phi.AAC.2
MQKEQKQEERFGRSESSRTWSCAQDTGPSSFLPGSRNLRHMEHSWGQSSPSVTRVAGAVVDALGTDGTGRVGRAVLHDLSVPSSSPATVPYPNGILSAAVGVSWAECAVAVGCSVIASVAQALRGLGVAAGKLGAREGVFPSWAVPGVTVREGT